MKSSVASLAFLIGSLPVSAFAQIADGGDDRVLHQEESPEIIVTALSRDRVDVLGGTSVLRAGELAAALRPSLGETLSGLPGVSSTAFGPNASRPILRGFQGDRIRVLTDGIGSFDASTSSVDHAVAINPMTATRIEVLRGPSALLYGSSAIGGVVNIIDGRIPRYEADEAIHLEARGGYASAAEERSGAGRVDVPLTDNFVVHLDGNYAKTGDLRTGGYLLSKSFREEAAASDDPEIAALATKRGRISNTASRSWELAGGAAFVFDSGSIGASVNRLGNRYGVPSRPEIGLHHDDDDEDHDAHGHENIRINLRQTRFDLRAEVKPVSGFFSRISMRAAHADYRHDEIQDDGSIGTRFFNKGSEARLEFSQRQRGAWAGAFGAQLFTRDYKVLGEEAFITPTKTEQAGIFALQALDFGKLRAEAGARVERTWIDAAASETRTAIARRFTSFSASLGAQLEIVDDWRIGFNLTHSERAPTAEELFSSGPHLATQSYEIGNPGFGKERSNGAEITLRGRSGGNTIEISAFYNDFANFIHQSPNGDEAHGLPVFLHTAAGAKQWGGEAEVNLVLADVGKGSIIADAMVDFVRVTIDGAGPAPFIPPLRILGGVEYQSDPLIARVEVERVTGQDRVAAFETETRGFTLTNARIEWRPKGPDGHFSLQLAANNIFDVSARRHSSYLKDFAPLAGRDIRVGASIRF